LLHDDYDDVIICLSCLHVSFHTIKLLISNFSGHFYAVP
jgi:hypothetical protein